MEPNNAMANWSASNEDGHEGTTCNPDCFKCVNCGGSHLTSSRECPVYLKEKYTIKIKTENNISYSEAKQLASVSNDLTVTNRPSFASKVSRCFSDESTRTRMNWTIDADNFTMLPVAAESFDKIIIPRKANTSKTVSQSTQSSLQSSKSSPKTNENVKSNTEKSSSWGNYTV